MDREEILRRSREEGNDEWEEQTRDAYQDKILAFSDIFYTIGFLAIVVLPCFDKLMYVLCAVLVGLPLVISRGYLYRKTKNKSDLVVTVVGLATLLLSAWICFWR